MLWVMPRASSNGLVQGPPSETCTMISSQARQRAERTFIRQARLEDGRKVMIENEVQADAIREKTTRLRALRLAREAAAKASPDK